MSENTKTTESIVAYLDGELNPSESQIIEKQLAADANVRCEVDALARTWDMLDELDEVRVSEEFTNKTLTSIQAVKNSEPETANGARLLREWLPTLATSMGIVVAVALGFASTRFYTEAGEKFRELPLLENLHIYEDVDVEMAKKLQESGLFDE